MLDGAGISVYPAAPHQPQRLEVCAEGEPCEPPGVHPVVGDRELLEHRAAPPDCGDPVVAPLAPGELELHEALASMGEDGEADVGDPGPSVETLDGAYKAEDLEVVECGDGAEAEIGASVELQLLKSGATIGDGDEARLGVYWGGDGELAEAGEAPRDSVETTVDGVRGKEAAVADGRVGVGLDGDGDGAAVEHSGGGGGGRGGEGGGDEVEVGEVGEAEGEAAVEEAPFEEGEGTAEAPREAEPALGDEGGGAAEVVGKRGEDAEEELVGEPRGEVGGGGGRRGAI